ncbi:type II toxin-antitoxin system RelE/ParE family toxin [Kovacikia minuta]|uniref:type II toxin-antitoxin system RelE/ParE family toxin n=1 Tax=Kovacikia minuta TaxID=2931930 RepID=UPI0036F3B05D
MQLLGICLRSTPNIAQNSPQYATRTIDRLTRRSQQIANFPLSGRVVSEFETKQIREVIEGSYRIIYYIKPDQIDILAVLHGSQQMMQSEDE